MKKKLSLYAITSELKDEIQKLQATKSRCKVMLKAMENLGKFSDITRLFKTMNSSEMFLDSLYIVDHNETKFYFTNEKENTPKTKWLVNASPHYVIAKEEKDNQYSLYTTIDGTPSKAGDVYMMEDIFLYVHGNKVHQYYDFIKGEEKLRITLEQRNGVLSVQNIETLRAAVKKHKPTTAIQYTELLSSIIDIASLPTAEITKYRKNIDKEKITISDGKVLALVANPNHIWGIGKILASQKEGTTISKSIKDPMNPWVASMELNITDNCVKDIAYIKKFMEELEEEKIEKYAQQMKSKTTQVVFGTIGTDEVVLYSYIQEANTLEFAIFNANRDKKTEEKFLAKLNQQKPTNIIEFLKVAEESELLDQNPTFLAVDSFGEEIIAKISKLNGEIVEYIVPEEVYECTKEQIDYETPISPYYQKDPEAFQFRKKKSS